MVGGRARNGTSVIDGDTVGRRFLTGLGGLITLPVTLPADFTTLWITQARLAGAIAHLLRGYDVRSDEVRSVVLMSLVGSSATEALAQAGVQISTKSAISAIKQVPGRVLIEINKKVGYRLITKAGSKGIVNLTKLAPLVGGVVGGGVSFTSTRAAGSWAKKNFPATENLAASATAAPDDTEQERAWIRNRRFYPLILICASWWCALQALQKALSG